MTPRRSSAQHPGAYTAPGAQAPRTAPPSSYCAPAPRRSGTAARCGPEPGARRLSTSPNAQAPRHCACRRLQAPRYCAPMPRPGATDLHSDAHAHVPRHCASTPRRLGTAPWRPGAPSCCPAPKAQSAPPPSAPFHCARLEPRRPTTEPRHLGASAPAGQPTLRQVPRHAGSARQCLTQVPRLSAGVPRHDAQAPRRHSFAPRNPPHYAPALRPGT